MKKVLSNKREVKQLSNELTAHVLVGIISQKVMPFKPMTNSCIFPWFQSSKGGDKKAVTANISETLKRVSKSVN